MWLVYIRFPFHCSSDVTKKQERRARKNIVDKEGIGNMEKLWLNFEANKEDKLVSFSLYLFLYFFFVRKNFRAFCLVLNFGHHSFLLRKCYYFIIYWHCFGHPWNIFNPWFKCYQVLDLLEIAKDITFLPFFITIITPKPNRATSLPNKLLLLLLCMLCLYSIATRINFF